MRIETYSDKYQDDVLRIVENFHKESISEFDELIDIDSIRDTIRNFKDEQSESCFLLIIDEVCQGMLFGVEYASMINKNRIFQEIIWYVNPEFRSHGVKLLKIVENVLRERGVGIMIMAVMENSKTDKIKDFYIRLGYRPMEVHYVRKL